MSSGPGIGVLNVCGESCALNVCRCILRVYCTIVDVLIGSLGRGGYILYVCWSSLKLCGCIGVLYMVGEVSIAKGIVDVHNSLA